MFSGEKSKLALITCSAKGCPRVQFSPSFLCPNHTISVARPVHLPTAGCSSFPFLQLIANSPLIVNAIKSQHSPPSRVCLLPDVYELGLCHSIFCYVVINRGSVVRCISIHLVICPVIDFQGIWFISTVRSLSNKESLF